MCTSPMLTENLVARLTIRISPSDQEHLLTRPRTIQSYAILTCPLGKLFIYLYPWQSRISFQPSILPSFHPPIFPTFLPTYLPTFTYQLAPHLNSQYHFHCPSFLFTTLSRLLPSLQSHIYSLPCGHLSKSLHPASLLHLQTT